MCLRYPALRVPPAETRLTVYRRLSVLRTKLKEELDIFDLEYSLCEKSVHSFCTLTIFPEGLSEMMSACKARAPDEGGMMNSL